MVDRTVGGGRAEEISIQLDTNDRKLRKMRKSRVLFDLHIWTA